MAKCLEWGEDRTRECNEWRDNGHSECAEWRSSCCDWWPCSMFCEIISWFCFAFVWIANVVCVGWTVITTAFCVLWDVVTTVYNAILVTLESVFGWILSALAFLIEMLETIPVLGTLIRWAINFVTHVINIVAGIVDAVLGFVGIRPEKLLRVCTIILKDENGSETASLHFARTVLQLAADVYKRDANIRIIPSRPFKYSSGFADAETVDDSWVIVDYNNSDTKVLDVPCESGSAGADWLLPGSIFQRKSSSLCFFGSWRRVLGYGAPVTCFIIRSIPGGYLGCSTWITDYVTIDGENIIPPNPLTSPSVLAHELGHSCNLMHICVDEDLRNMMGTQTDCNPTSMTLPDTANPRMNNWQALLARASKHVTYF